VGHVGLGGRAIWVQQEACASLWHSLHPVPSPCIHYHFISMLSLSPLTYAKSWFRGKQLSTLNSGILGDKNVTQANKHSLFKSIKSQHISLISTPTSFSVNSCADPTLLYGKLSSHIEIFSLSWSLSLCLSFCLSLSLPPLPCLLPFPPNFEWTSAGPWIFVQTLLDKSHWWQRGRLWPHLTHPGGSW
jgi:hypothetical protein